MLTSTFASDYSQARSKLYKSAIVANIVADIRQEGGSFCKNEKGAWFEIGDYNAREKVSALLRDLLPNDYRSSAEAKAKAKTIPRRARATEKSRTQTQYYGQQLVESTRHSEVSSVHSTDSLGFAKSLEIDFFDIDDVF
jgi:hypothetical protein